MKFFGNVDVLKLQKEYHELCGKLIDLHLEVSADTPFEVYVARAEELEDRLNSIEHELLFYGVAIDKHHMLMIVGD